MQVSVPHMTGHHIERRGSALTMLLGLAAVLQIGATIGLAYVVGFSSVRAVLDTSTRYGSPRWPAPWASLSPGTTTPTRAYSPWPAGLP